MIGGLLGVATGVVLRFLYSSAPRSRYWLALLPWRTGLALGLSVSSTLILALLFGAQPVTSTISVTVTVTLLVWMLTTSIFVEHASPSKLSVRFISAARTLAVMTVVIALLIGGQLGNLGLGAVLYKNVMTQMNTEAIFPILVVLLIFILAIDLLLGIAQLIASLVGRNSSSPREPATTE